MNFLYCGLIHFHTTVDMRSHAHNNDVQCRSGALRLTCTIILLNPIKDLIHSVRVVSNGDKEQYE